MDPLLFRVLAAAVGASAGIAAIELAVRVPARLGLGSRRRPWLVLATLAVALGIAQVLLGAGATLGEALLPLFVHTALAAIVLAAAAIDLDHLVLPNELTFGGAALALLTAPARAVGLAGALGGLALGLALTLVPWLVYRRVRRRAGMGLGDAKLALLAGAWHGPAGVFFVVLLGAAQSVLAAGTLAAIGRRYPIPASVVAEIADLRARAAAGDAEAARELADDPAAAEPTGVLATSLPLGPFLALGCVEVLFLRRWLVEHVLAWLAR